MLSTSATEITLYITELVCVKANIHESILLHRAKTWFQEN